MPALLATSGQRIRAVRAAVQKELEACAQTGAIGSSLQAEVDDRRAGRATTRRCASLGDDLRFVLITSAATRRRGGDALAIAVHAERARRSASAAGTSAPTSASIRAHPTLCGRCVANLFGAGRAAHVMRERAARRDALARWWLWLLRRAVIVARPATKACDRRRASRRARRARSRRSSASCSRSTPAPRSASSPMRTAGSAGSSPAIARRRLRASSLWLLRRGGSRWLCAGARADPRRRARQPLRPPDARARRRLPPVPLRAAGTLPAFNVADSAITRRRGAADPRQLPPAHAARRPSAATRR